MSDPTRPSIVVNAGRLWAGGVAAALVAALIAILGILVCRGILDIPILAPEGEGTWGDADTGTYAFAAALAALLATGLMHVLLLFTPRPYAFFGWIVPLATLAAAAAPFAVKADQESQLATAVVNLVIGAAIGMLVSESARGATRSLPLIPGSDRNLPPPPYRSP